MTWGLLAILAQLTLGPAAPAPLPVVPVTVGIVADARVAELERQLVDLGNEMLHTRADLANCKATVDSLDLTAQVNELVKRYETVYGGKWIWDDRQRRVVRVLEAPKEK